MQHVVSPDQNEKKARTMPSTAVRNADGPGEAQHLKPTSWRDVKSMTNPENQFGDLWHYAVPLIPKKYYGDVSTVVEVQ